MPSPKSFAVPTAPSRLVLLRLVAAMLVGSTAWVSPGPARADVCLANPVGTGTLPAARSKAPSPATPALGIAVPAALSGSRHTFLGGGRWVPYAASAALLLATDRETQRFLTRSFAGRTAVHVSRAVSVVGSTESCVAAPLLLYALGGSHEKQAARKMANALVTAGVVTQVLKIAVGRARPDESDGAGDLRGPSLHFESFPSGHATAAFAMATVLAGEYRRYRTPLYGLAVAVAASRILQNKHFAGDVFVGALIGTYAGQRARAGSASIVGIKF